MILVDFLGRHLALVHGFTPPNERLNRIGHPLPKLQKLGLVIHFVQLVQRKLHTGFYPKNTTPRNGKRD